MLNNAVSKVVLVVEQIVNGDWLEEFSASDVARKEATTNCNTKAHTETSELITGLFLRGSRRLRAIKLSKVWSESSISTGSNDSGD